MSLSGRTVLITRPLTQGAELAEMLHQEGATPLLFPLIEIQAKPEALTGLASAANQVDWLIFVSPSAVEAAWPTLENLAPNVRLACIGAASARKLQRLARRPVVFPRAGHDSHSLLSEPEFQAISGQQILIVRGEGGRAELGQTLRARAARVDYAEIYQRLETAPDWTHLDPLLLQQRLDACIVTSGEIAELLFRLAGSARVPALQCLQYCVPHPRIAERLAALGVVRIVTTRADNAAMVADLREWFSRHP